MKGQTEALEVRLLLEAIHARYGYDLRGYAPDTMGRRVMAALIKTGLPHCGALQHAMLHDPAIFAIVLDTLLVRVSEMFRDPDFYRVFRTEVVARLKTYPVFKMWHCGCASGEEVYASAIVLREAGLTERAQIYATDLLPQALAEAEAGLYSADRGALFEQNYRGSGGTEPFVDYTTRAYGGIAMKALLRRHVHFFEHNVVSDHVFGEMNVIFCRNVLIYFDPPLRAQVIKKLRQSLCPGGFLCLGMSEQVTVEEGFAPFARQQHIYRREEA